MESDTVFLFTRFGMGEATEGLQHNLAKKFLFLTLESGTLPARILFYTEGVKLACQESPVLDELRALESKGVMLILCKTCLDYYNLSQKVAVGIVRGMGDIIESLQQAGKVISL